MPTSNLSQPMIRQAKLYRYELPMDSGVIVRQQRLSQREGYIIELLEIDNNQEQQAKRIALGECAPLPSFSEESLAEVEAQLLPVLNQWQQTGQWPNFESLFPSVAFGLSAAKYELEQKLPEQGEYRAAPLCSGDPDEFIALFEEDLTQQKAKVAKIKVGLYEPIRDGMLVDLFLQSIPDLQLRLDANCSWTLEKALKFAQYISPEVRQRIAFLEEPCQTPQQSLAFASQTHIGIAWDETLQKAVKKTDFSISDLNAEHLNALVIKPTLVGSIDRCIELVHDAKAQGIDVVFSSSLESTIGLTQLARLSAWLTPGQIPGLDTLQLFQSQLERPWGDNDLPLIQLQQQQLVFQC